MFLYAEKTMPSQATRQSVPALRAARLPAHRKLERPHTLNGSWSNRCASSCGCARCPATLRCARSASGRQISGQPAGIPRWAARHHFPCCFCACEDIPHAAIGLLQGHEYLTKPLESLGVCLYSCVLSCGHTDHIWHCCASASRI